MGLPAKDLINLQILVGITNEAGVLKISMGDGQVIAWPSAVPNLPSGNYYLNLSSRPQLPSKAELTELVLQEILRLE